VLRPIVEPSAIFVGAFASDHSEFPADGPPVEFTLDRPAPHGTDGPTRIAGVLAADDPPAGFPGDSARPGRHFSVGAAEGRFGSRHPASGRLGSPLGEHPAPAAGARSDAAASPTTETTPEVSHRGPALDSAAKGDSLLKTETRASPTNVTRREPTARRSGGQLSRAPGRPESSVPAASSAPGDERTAISPRGELRPAVAFRESGPPNRAGDEPPRGDRREAAANASSTVHVTIGRIEVRAVQTGPSAPPLPLRTQPAPPLSLEEYLRHRIEDRGR
jgi:hypothetical protein